MRTIEGRLVDWAARVEAVSGDRLTLERPLRLDVRPEWKPEVWSSAPSVQDVGLEDFTIEFPDSPYGGHFTEKGFNGVFFDGVHHGWVRRVSILDADNGVLFHMPTTSLQISRWVTVSDLRLATRWRKGRVTGHHGIALEGPQDCLISDFAVDTEFIHDLTVDTVACGNVFSRGRGRNLNFDHHRVAPYENLFTEIDAGTGDRLWLSSGPSDGGPQSAARTTLWNVRAARPPAAVPPYPQITIVGMTAWPAIRSDSAWIEPIPSDALVPRNLHEAQLARRRAGGR
jgi:hypothetical protein